MTITMNKNQLFPKVENALAERSNEEIVQLLFDYFDYTTLQLFYNHIADELNVTLDIEEEED